MEYPELEWLEHGGAAAGEEQTGFRETSPLLSGGENPLWDWQCGYGAGPDNDMLVEQLLLHRLPRDHFFPCQDVLQEFRSTFEGGHCSVDVGGRADEDLAASWHGGESERCDDGGSRKADRAVTFEEVSRYFYVPITQAAKELNVGLTQLKRRCRELGIPRWPHRKMKSLQSLIKNVKELVRENGEMGEAQLRQAVDVLERERKAMEKVPGMQLEERTKRLRQACFKVNFKKRHPHAPGRKIGALSLPRQSRRRSPESCGADGEVAAGRSIGRFQGAGRIPPSPSKIDE